MSTYTPSTVVYNIISISINMHRYRASHSDATLRFRSLQRRAIVPRELTSLRPPSVSRVERLC